MDFRYRLKMWLINDPQKKYWRLRERALHGRFELLRSWYRLRTQLVLSKMNAYIPTEPDINRFLAPHGLNGTFVSSGCKIGRGCTLMQQVTIGSNTFTDSKQHGSPMLGDNVFVGAGAKIIGGVRVGNNVRIGANCVVFEDVPDNATVVCAKPRIIVREESRDNSFVIYDKYKELTCHQTDNEGNKE